MSLAGKIVRSLLVLQNHCIKRAFGPWSRAKLLNCVVIRDLRCSLTVTSEPSSENLSPPAITARDSTCAAEPDESIPAACPADSFTSRARITGVAASQSLAVLSQLAVRTCAPSGLKANHRTVP